MDGRESYNSFGSLIRGGASEQSRKPEVGVRLRRQSLREAGAATASPGIPQHTASLRPSAAGDIIRGPRVSESQLSRLPSNPRTSPTIPSSYHGSSPAPVDGNAHIAAPQPQGSVIPFATMPHRALHAEPATGGLRQQLKSRKSLRQRLDGEEIKDDEFGAKLQQIAEHCGSHLLSHSRSGSVASSAYGRPVPDDDISSIMMAGAAELRNTRFESEEQRREIAFLKSQLDKAKSDKEEALQRLKSVKQAAKQGLESTSRSLNDMRASLDGLKAQSEEVFAYTKHVKAAFPDVQELRESLQQAAKDVELLFNENGHLYKLDETKALLREYQDENTKSRQVADLLRERLQTIGAELVEAKTRSCELECAQVQDRDALRSTTASLTNATARIHELTERLDAKQKEVYKELLSGSELVEKLAASDERALQLKETLGAKESELDQMYDVQRENARLTTLLNEREAHIQSIQEKFDAAKATLDSLNCQIGALESQASNNNEKISEMAARIKQGEGELQTRCQELQDARQELGSIVAKEKASQRELVHAAAERIEFKAELRTANDSLEEAKRDLEARKDSVHSANTRCQVLEDRIEGQLVSLRIAKETIGNLQERLTESESKYARDMEAANGKLTGQIAVLEQQKSALETKLSDLEAAVRVTQETGSAVKAQYADKLAMQEEVYRIQLVSAQQRVEDAQTALEDARSTTKGLEEQVAASREDIAALKEELREARIPSPAHKEAIDGLQAETTALRAANTELVLRARSLDARYRTGDLNEEEKVFINTLVRTSQSIHEQELVTKGNELRRRENRIKELHARIHLLETTLAKHLKSQAKSNTVVGNETHSLIDPGAWVPTSEKSSSQPQAQIEQAEEDRPSTNVDNTVTAKPTPAPNRPSSARVPLMSVPQPAPNTLAHTTPARPIRQAGAPTARSTPVPMMKTPGAAVPRGPDKSSPLVYPAPKAATARISVHKTTNHAAHTDKPAFSRLATDRSDEIVDFDVASPGVSPLHNSPDRCDAAKTKLGKRDRASDNKSPGGKHSKRLRTSVRTRSIAQKGNDNSPIEQSPEPLAPKSRARKRH